MYLKNTLTCILGCQFDVKSNILDRKNDAKVCSHYGISLAISGWMLCKAFNLHKNLRDQWHLDALPSLAIIGHILVFLPFSRRIIDRAQLRCWVHAGLGKCADYLNEFSRHTTTLSSFTDTTISNFRSLWAHIFGWNITLESTSRLLGILFGAN